MSMAYPIPRDTRQKIYVATAGQALFGPSEFILFDAHDVQVLIKPPAAAEWTPLNEDQYTVAVAAPGTALPFFFTVQLSTPRSAGDLVWIKGARLGSRTTDVTRAGTIRSQLLETELDRQVATEQELRRDIDALIAGGAEHELIASGVANNSTAPGGTVADALGLLDGRLDVVEPIVDDLVDRVGVIEGKVARFDTIASLEGTIVAASVQWVQVAGFYAPGVGAHLRIKDAAGDVISADGAKWKVAEPLLNFEMFGCKGDRVRNDTVEFQKALDFAKANGISRVTGGRRYLVDTINVPDNVSLCGLAVYQANQTGAFANYYNVGSLICPRAGATINTGQSTSLSGLSIIKDGFTFPLLNDAACTAAIASFAGTAIKSVGTNVYLENLLIIGFAQAVDSDATASQGWLNISNIRIDCLSGIKYKNSGASGNWHGITCWPYISGSVAGASQANIHRPGSALIIDGSDGSGDAWLTVLDAGVFGYKVAYDIISGAGINMKGCQADYGSGFAGDEIAFKITGGTINNSGRILLEGCRSISVPTTVSIDLQESSDVSHVRIDGCDFAPNTVGIKIIRGSAIVDGTVITNGPLGIDVGPLAGDVTISDTKFDTLTTGVKVDAAWTGLGNISSPLFRNVTNALNIPAAVIGRFRILGVGLETVPVLNQLPNLTLFEDITILGFHATSGNADEHLWDIVNGAGTMSFRALSDAGVAATWLLITRSAGVVNLANFLTPVRFQNAGLRVRDTNDTHDLIIRPGSNITADRTLSVVTGDADRTLTLVGNATVGRTIIGPAAGLTVSNGDGAAGDPTLALANDLAAIEALSATGIPKRTGTDAWALTAGVADLAATTANRLFGSNGSGTSGLITLPAAGLALASGALALTNDLAAIEAFASTGTWPYRSATDTWAAVTIGGNLSFAGGTLNLAAAINPTTLRVGTLALDGTFNPSVQTDGQLLIANTGPSFALKVTGASADNKYWDFTANNTDILFRTVNDAFSAAIPWLQASRSGTTITYVAAPSSSFNIGRTAVTSSWLAIAAGTTAKSQINLQPSAAPTTPADGDLWYDGTNIKFRQSGTTKTVTLV